ncbi:MAG TPA: adenosylcobinamide-GDP ribazoletransferase [Mycobacteriales bacterium]|jgi:adenosylcobinamide-GDP ribazoletransferase|nr:adenosylcobinamide-GDP ribazoletransferase [Mycobacteriales bacterium]
MRLPVRGLVAAFGLLTVARVGDGSGIRSALRWCLLVGAVLGGIAAGLVAAGHQLFPGTAGSALSAAIVLAVLALLTRGLHLDGLADTADGLGRIGDPQRSLQILRQADIGPFGVATVVLVVLIEVAALARCIDVGRGPGAVLLAVVVGRLAMLQAGVRGIRAARSDGLGAQVAGTVPAPFAIAATVVVAAIAVTPVFAGHGAAALRLAIAVPVGSAAALLLRWRATARFGGITGDVFGAVCEIATAAALVTVAVR